MGSGSGASRRPGPIALALALALAATAPAAPAAVLLETFPVSAENGTTNGTPVSPQAAVDPDDATGERRIVVASEIVDGAPRTGAWRWSGTAWTRTTLPAAGVDGGGAPDVVWGADGRTWVAHVGDADADPCDSGAGIYLSTANYPGAWNSTLILPNDDYTFGHVSMARDLNAAEQAIVVADARTHGGDCDPDSGGQKIVLASPYAPGDVLPGVTLSFDGSDPAVVSLPPAGVRSRLALAFVKDTGEVGVTVCQTLPTPPPLFWSCPTPTPFPTGGPASLANGAAPPIAIGPDPDIARGPDGRLHLVYTVLDGADTDVVYRWSDDEGSSWSAATPVADPQDAQADQFLPAVSVTPALPGTPFSRGRVDITFLDRRADGVRYQPFATSFAIFDPDTAATRSADRALDDVPQAAPLHDGIADVGDRLAVVALGASDDDPSTHPTLAWWPGSAAAAGGDLVNSKLNHGRSIPTVPTTVVPTPKNTPVTVPDLLLAHDEDGDPVRVTLTAAPAFGTLDSTTYVPGAGFAGNDAVGIVAEDGYGNARATERALAVLNTTPALPDHALVGVPAGGTVSLTLSAADPDLGESLTYALVGALPSALAGAVQLSPTGVLTLAPGPRTRAPGVVFLHVRVSDSSPAAGGVDDALVPVKVEPRYVDFDLDVTLRRNRNAVEFRPAITDVDPERDQRRPRYLWHFGDGSPDLTTDIAAHHYRRPGRYQWNVTVTIPRAEGASTTSRSGTVAISPAGVAMTQVRQRLDRRRRQLVVRLTSRVSGTARVTLRAGGRSTPPRALAIAAGREAVVRLPLAPLSTARSASLVVRLTGVAGPNPDPTPIRRRVRIR